jgi:hypothetical protein
MGLDGKKRIAICLCIAVGRWFLLAVFICVTTEVALTSAMEMTREVAAALEKPFLHFFFTWDINQFRCTIVSCHT